MKRIGFFLILILIILAGCAQQEIKEGQVYVVNEDDLAEEKSNDMLNIEGRIPFQKYVNESLAAQQDVSQILLTISPNGKEIYLMEKIETDSVTPVIKGEPGKKVRIVKEDIATKEQQIVIENIPFVSRVLWNSEGNMVAFGGGGRLTIYNSEKKSTVMEDMLSQDNITNFFWSPINENKLYSEQSDLANGSIYYLASKRKLEAYETREEAYYKGKLDSSYYYGTKWDLTNGDINTVILDKQGKIIKVLTRGRFRDAYQKSLVVVGERGFGLFYVKDINSSEKVITLTDDYIYDVKFIADGKIAYTTAAEDIENNLFYLHLVSSNGSQLKKFKVYGGSIAVLPDGKSGYISGPVWQQVDFVENKLEQDSLETKEAGESEAIYATIRGAMTTLYDYELKGEQSWSRLKKYFINSHSPNQWAYFDMEMIFQGRAQGPLRKNNPYMMKIELKSYAINSTGDGASVIISVDTKNPYGRGVDMDYSLELMKVEGIWYVTGFSTFPQSEEREDIEAIVQETVTMIQAGKLFAGELEKSRIIIGQIQFWRSGLSHLAPSVGSANSVKVFLQVKNQGKEEVYKLVLEKVNQNYWKPVKLTKEDLSSL